MQQFSYQISDQSAATSLLEKILSSKCKLHRQFTCEYLHMKPSNFSPRLCCQCMEERSIPPNEYVSIRLLLQASSNSTFNAYPKLNDNSITQQIQLYRGSSDKVQEELLSFFDNLKSTISLTIEKVKSSQKDKLSFLQTNYQDIFDTLAQISQVQKLQTLINNENEDELRNFINQQFSNSDTYTQKINNKLNQYKRIYEGFSLSEPQNKLNQIVRIIEGIEFFPTILQNQANNSQQQTPLPSQPQQQQEQLLLQQQQEQLQQRLQQKKKLQQQQEQQNQQQKQQQQEQNQYQQLQKQQKQLQQQQQIEQQQSTISKSVYTEYASLVKRGLEKKILERLSRWWELRSEWERREWRRYNYAKTYEEWQNLEEEERQKQLRVLREHVPLSN